MTNELETALDKVSAEIDAALDAMYIGLKGLNERMERVEKWISDQDKKSQT